MGLCLCLTLSEYVVIYLRLSKYIALSANMLDFVGIFRTVEFCWPMTEYIAFSQIMRESVEISQNFSEFFGL